MRQQIPTQAWLRRPMVLSELPDGVISCGKGSSARVMAGPIGLVAALKSASSGNEPARATPYRVRP